MKKILVLLAATALLFSCGKKSKDDAFEELKLKPETTVVSGDLGSCYKVVDKEYKTVEKDLFGGLLTIELERTDAELPFELKNGISPSSYGTFGKDVYVHVGFGIEFLDEDGTVLEKVSVENGYSNEDPEALAKLKKGEKGTIRFIVPKELKKAVSFRVTSAYENVDSSDWDSSSSDDDNDDELSSGSGSSNWDEVLDEYEKFIDSYIRLAKKAAKGDISAATEMSSYMSKAESLSNKLENANDNMSASQLARFQKLQTKLVNAASSLY